MCTTWYSGLRSPLVTRMWSRTSDAPSKSYVYRWSTGSVVIRSVRIEPPLPSAVPVRVGRVDPAGRQREVGLALGLDHRRARGRAVDRRGAAVDERDPGRARAPPCRRWPTSQSSRPPASGAAAGCHRRPWTPRPDTGRAPGPTRSAWRRVAAPAGTWLMTSVDDGVADAAAVLNTLAAIALRRAPAPHRRRAVPDPGTPHHVSSNVAPRPLGPGDCRVPSRAAQVRPGRSAHVNISVSRGEHAVQARRRVRP